jgi:hypothetical protein
MAIKKEKIWGTVIGAIGGAIFTYLNTEKTDKDKWLKVLGGTALGAGSGYALACIFGEPADTLNYSCYDKNGNRVYEGICYEDRKKTRIREHKANGKKIDRVKFDQLKPRSEASTLEKTKIKKFRPRYNIQHNCYPIRKTG